MKKRNESDLEEPKVLDGEGAVKNASESINGTEADVGGNLDENLDFLDDDPDLIDIRREKEKAALEAER